MRKLAKGRLIGTGKTVIELVNTVTLSHHQSLLHNCWLQSSRRGTQLHSLRNHNRALIQHRKDRKGCGNAPYLGKSTEPLLVEIGAGTAPLTPCFAH